MDAVSALLSAFGLSTAAGLNAYIPLLVIGLMARYTSLITLSEPYDLLTHPAALIVLGVLAALDFVGDKIPAVDHALHVAGVVIHPIAGAILFMAANSSTGSVHPALSAICGLALAGGAHGVRAAVRPAATATTAGVANPIISFVEDIISLIVAILAVMLPLLAAAMILGFVILLIRFRRRFTQKRTPVTP